MSHSPAVTRETLGFALLAAGRTAERERQAERVDLVWTGPGGAERGLRRIEQVLLELIQSAEKHLLLVTFTAYEVVELREAIAAAVGRGVSVRLVTEHAKEDGGAVKFSPVPALLGPGTEVMTSVRVFHWPEHVRPKVGGHAGSLHAKSAVADDRTLVVSSANFTGHALAINMELGLRVSGGPLPGRVREHFDDLIRRGDLVRLGE